MRMPKSRTFDQLAKELTESKERYNDALDKAIEAGDVVEADRLLKEQTEYLRLFPVAQC